MVEAASERTAREAEQLLRPHPTLGVPVPSFDGRSLPNVTASVLRALDVELPGDPAILPPLAPDLDPFAGRRPEGTVVVLLVDGLGWLRLAAASEGRAAPDWLSRARPISSVFPTTTAVALTSLSTGTAPGRHGVVGHRVFLPAFGSVTEILRMSPVGVPTPEALAGPAWTPSAVSGVPSVFRRGAVAAAVSRDRFAGSAFTRLLYDGAEYVGYATASEFGLALGRVLARPEPPPLVYAYWDDLDTVQHLQGPDPALAGFEASQVARILGLAARYAGDDRARRTTVLISSDHGQVPADAALELRVDEEPGIVPLLAHPPTGDRRAAFFAPRPGRSESLARVLSERLPVGHRLLRTEAAVRAGLFGPGPHHPELTDRLGEWLALVPSPHGITYRLPGSPPRRRHLAGAHGGLEPDELLVPLVSGRLRDLV